MLGLLSSRYLTQVAGFSTTLPAFASQCGPYTVTWSAPESAAIGPPFTLSIIPVNGPQASSADAGGLGAAGLSLPVVTAIPDSSFNATSRSGTFQISALPFRAGERFIVVMDDGFGLGTGGVSTIQTVFPSSAQGSGCLPAADANANVPFTLSTLTPTSCQSITITSGPAKAIRGFIPGGAPFSLDRGTATGTTVTTEWTINVASGTSFVLLFEGETAGVRASSGLITVGNGNGCSTANGPSTTVTGGTAGVAAASSSTASSSHSTSQSTSSGRTTPSVSSTTTLAGNSAGSGNGNGSGNGSTRMGIHSNMITLLPILMALFLSP
ncbi:hypothetical protein FRC17_010519 [Serendipita sp. 399]|nr:hypothetical protein FRC17_010519 [Serendipita sp. 399]